jgi:hypothetical protein
MAVRPTALSEAFEAHEHATKCHSPAQNCATSVLATKVTNTARVLPQELRLVNKFRQQKHRASKSTHNFEKNESQCGSALQCQVNTTSSSGLLTHLNSMSLRCADRLVLKYANLNCEKQETEKGEKP